MSLAEDWEKFTGVGEKLGYTGVELRKWVTDQLMIREDRRKADADRQQRRLDREQLQNDLAAKAQRELLDRQEAKEKAEREAAERLKQMELEIEKVRLQAEEKQQEQEQRQHELDKIQAPPKFAHGPDKGEVSDGANDSDATSRCSRTSSSRRHHRKAGPKLPHFHESKDNIDSYLRRFERYAVLQDWPADEWALYLSALLKGRALEVYSRLTEEEAHDYCKLKAALLRKYELTAEGFRRKFYEVRREQSETAAQFTSRLMGYLDRWIQLAEIEQTFQGLKELMVREQFLHVSEDHLALYLRERSSRGLSKLVELADLYLDAQLHRPKLFKNGKSVQSCPKGHNDARLDRPQLDARQSDGVSDRRGGHLQSERVCYSCGQPGHIRKDCKRKQQVQVVVIALISPRRVVCYLLLKQIAIMIVPVEVSSIYGVAANCHTLGVWLLGQQLRQVIRSCQCVRAR